MDEGLLVVISGPSGAGKGTICKQLLMEMGDLKVSVSATTRKPRAGEAEGISYYFIEEEEFINRINNNEFLEYAKVYGNFYGTPKDEVFKQLKAGNDIILEIDIQGALQVKATMPEGVFIFIAPPSIEDLVNRLCNRDQDSPESIAARLAASEVEMTFMPQYDYVVVNDNLGDAVARTKAIIMAERCKISNMKMGG